MPLTIRPAAAADQAAIRAIVRAAPLNPIGIDWPRFLLVASGEQIVGIGQVKPHGDGTRELASIAVVPEWRGRGIASMIVRALLVRETGTLYLMCAPEMAGYYPRFGFRRLAPAELPPYFRRIDRLMGVLRLLTAGRLHGPVVMRRDA